VGGRGGAAAAAGPRLHRLLCQHTRSVSVEFCGFGLGVSLGLVSAPARVALPMQLLAFRLFYFEITQHQSPHPPILKAPARRRWFRVWGRRSLVPRARPLWQCWAATRSRRWARGPRAPSERGAATGGLWALVLSQGVLPHTACRRPVPNPLDPLHARPSTQHSTHSILSPPPTHRTPPPRYWRLVATAADTCIGGGHRTAVIADKNLVPNPVRALTDAADAMKESGAWGALDVGGWGGLGVWVCGLGVCVCGCVCEWVGWVWSTFSAKGVPKTDSLHLGTACCCVVQDRLASGSCIRSLTSPPLPPPFHPPHKAPPPWPCCRHAAAHPRTPKQTCTAHCPSSRSRSSSSCCARCAPYCARSTRAAWMEVRWSAQPAGWLRAARACRRCCLCFCFCFWG